MSSQHRSEPVHSQPRADEGSPTAENLPLGDTHGTIRVAAVAERIGVAAGTLRTWDRRYGLGPTGHTAGAHRRYTSEDVARLIYMRRLIVQGLGPAAAAPIALAYTPESDVVMGNQIVDDNDTLAPVSPIRPVDGPQIADSPERGRPQSVLDGDLRSVPTAARTLLRAARGLRGAAIRQNMMDYLNQHGVVRAWEEAALPALQTMGQHWAQTGTGVEMEHVLAESIQASLAAFMHTQNTYRGLVLLASAEDELHSLPLSAVAAALAEHHIRTVSLGSRVPHESLLSALQQLTPDAVFLFAVMRVPRNQLDMLNDLVSRHRTLLGGPGWLGESVPRDAVYASSLGAVVDHLRMVAQV